MISLHDRQHLPTIRLLLDAARFAEAAYQGTIKGERVYSRVTTTEAFVVQEASRQVVVFTGSNQLPDWILNFIPVPVSYGASMTHAGFAAAHRSVWGRVKALLNPYKPVVFYGHSQGAALAEKSCEFVPEFPGRGFVGFGKPNTHFCLDKAPSTSAYDLKLSVVDCGDLVTMVPKWMFRSNPEQEVVFRGHRGQWLKGTDKAYRDEERRLTTPVRGHLIAGYREALEALYLEVAQGDVAG